VPGTVFRASTLCVVVPLLVAGAVYVNTLGSEFVFDDRSQILFNPWVRELRNFPQAISSPVWAFKVNYGTNYFRPFQMGSYNLLWALGGGEPFVFHLTNVAIHMLATALLALLVLALSRDAPTAFGAGLLFAVHPIHTEAVAWIACLPELGMTLFVLGALLLHARSWSAPGSLRVSAWVACAVALAAKETAAVMPALVFLMELWCAPGAGADRWKRATRAATPYAVLVLAYLVVRKLIVGEVAFVQGGATPLETVWTAPGLALGYVGKMLWPADLKAFYVLDAVGSPFAATFLWPAAGLLLVAAAGAFLLRRRGDLSFAGALLVLPLLPALAVPSVAVAFFSERYTYLPSAGLVWLVAAGIVAAARRWIPRRAAAAAIVVFVVCSMPAAVQTVSRNRVWSDDERLATATLELESRARAMWGILATFQGRDGRLEEALATYRRALEIFPGDVGLEVEELNTRFLLHRISADEFVLQLEPRILRSPGAYEPYFYLGTAQIRAGNSAAAEVAFRRAIELNPSFKPSYDGLTGALLAQGADPADALGLARLSGFSQGTASDRLLEGAAYLRAGDLDRAAEIIEAVLAEEPDSPSALLAMAGVASRRQQHRLAMDYCRKAIRRDRGLVDAYQQLGVSALRAGEPLEAIRALESAATLSPNDKEVFNRLGVAYVQSGRTEEAGNAWRRALEIDPMFEKARHNLRRLDP